MADDVDLKYEETHRIIANMAGVKMRLNAHKGDIEDVDPMKLIQMLRGEVDELEQAMTEGDMSHIIEESGDVFNFLVGVVHQQITLYRMRKD